MRRIRGASTRRNLRGFLAAGRRLQPARHRRMRVQELDVYLDILDEFQAEDKGGK